jgi:O-antigen/teichoic acid export membrane protein
VSSTSPSDSPKGSLRAAAVHGGLWTGAQVMVNKGVSLLGTLVLMYLLVPEQFGIASIALSIQSLVMVLPAFTLTDVLLTRPEACAAQLRVATGLCSWVTVTMSVMLVAAGYLAAAHYEQPGLVTAGFVIALRPVADLMLFGPQTLWRAALGFRRMAQMDAIGQTASTALSITMAALGAGFVSILLPPIVFTGVRAIMYGRPPIQQVPVEAPDPRPLFRHYLLSGLGQYVHGGLVMIPPILIAQFSDERHVGWFSTAFALSASINTVVAVSVGLVLQPVFAQMSGDRSRQSAAFVRSCAAIAGVAMPACLVQAALMGPAFRVALPERWAGAITMGVVMSIGQAFYFAVNPAMGLLKAQGRFHAFLVWQALQLGLVTAAMIVAAIMWGADPALSIVCVYGLYHLVSSPAGVWLSLRDAKAAVRSIREIFAKPAIAATIVVLPSAWALSMVPTGFGWDALRIVVIPLATLVLYPWVLAKIAPATHAECMHLLAAVTRGRLGRAIESAK